MFYCIFKCVLEGKTLSIVLLFIIFKKINYNCFKIYELVNNQHILFYIR